MGHELPSVCLPCRSVQYIDRGATEEFHTLSRYPNEMHKKMTLLNYFRSYMSEHLLKVCLREGQR